MLILAQTRGQKELKALCRVRWVSLATEAGEGDSARRSSGEGPSS